MMGKHSASNLILLSLTSFLVVIINVSQVCAEFPYSSKASTCPKRGAKGLGEHCCGDYECLTTICQRHSCVCLKEGEPCAGRDFECCGNNCDTITSKCICKDALEKCTADTECCGGRCTSKGKCCTALGMGCKEDDECCTSHCTAGFLGQLKCTPRKESRYRY